MKLDTYTVIPGLEYLANNPEFLSQETNIAKHCDMICIPRAYISKLIDLQIDHPDDERYPGLLKVLGDLFEQADGDSVQHASGHPISIRDIGPQNATNLSFAHYDQRRHEYQTIILAIQLSADHKVAILTDDNGLRALAFSVHIPVIHEEHQNYSGRRIVNLSPNDQSNYSDLSPQQWHNRFPHEKELHPNEFVVFHSPSVHVTNYENIQRYDTNERKLTPLHHYSHRNGFIGTITPRNDGQAMIMEALLAPVDKIPIVIIQGAFGTGKTFLATAAGYAGVESKTYDQIVICPRDSRLGDDIGAVPGDTFEKTRTKAHSVVDNFREVLRHEHPNQDPGQLSALVEKTLVTHCYFTPLAEVGGRSLTRSFIICDEFQDMSRQQARAVLTRTGEGSKLVILGDLNQINNPRLTPTSCGLAYAIKHLAGKPEIAFITMQASETTRSNAAKAMAKYL